MFKHLDFYRIILVSGPQRSGTTICARMIAHDTHYMFIDEGVYQNDFSTLKHRTLYSQRQVIQCPVWAVKLHELTMQDVCIVFMYRPVKEIIASQQRIKWQWEQVELDRYRALGIAIEDGTPIARVKYSYWENTQREKIDNPLEVQYASLADHPLWVPKAERVGWLDKQTAHGTARRR